jgi:hypothetical protein
MVTVCHPQGRVRRPDTLLVPTVAAMGLIPVWLVSTTVNRLCSGMEGYGLGTLRTRSPSHPLVGLPVSRPLSRTATLRSDRIAAEEGAESEMIDTCWSVRKSGSGVDLRYAEMCPDAVATNGRTALRWSLLAIAAYILSPEKAPAGG